MQANDVYLCLTLINNLNKICCISVPPVIVPFPIGDKPLHQNQYLSLSCSISEGDIPLKIFWTFKNQPIVNGEMDITISKLGKRSSVLTIDSVSGIHAGNFSCIAENTAGETSYTTELKVIGVNTKMCFFF